MLIVGLIIDVLLAVAFTLYTKEMFGGWGSAIFIGVFLGLVLCVMHWSVCRTPKKSSEFYDSWRKILHDDKRATLIRIASIGAMFYVYVGAVVAFPWLFDPGAAWWKMTIAVIAVAWPIVIMFMNYSKAGTLAKAKEHYSEVLKILSDSKYSKLVDNVGGFCKINPDTPLIGGLVRTDDDIWTMLWVINDLVYKYQIPYSIYAPTNREWNGLVKAINNGALQGEKRAQTIQQGLEISRSFCGLQQTVGGIAVWVTESLESKDRRALESQLND